MARVVREGVPYFAQWESKDLVEDILSGKVQARKDPRWRDSGADSPEDYEFWSWNLCGMACLKMILASEFSETYPLVRLGKTCMGYGGYVPKGEQIDGLFYRPFVKFVKEEFGLSGAILSPMRLKDIEREIRDDNYVIASVSYEIRNPIGRATRKGGHLVLMLGFDSDSRVLYLHNPSGLTYSRQYAEIKYSDFEKFFAGRGVVIYSALGW